MKKVPKPHLDRLVLEKKEAGIRHRDTIAKMQRKQDTLRAWIDTCETDIDELKNKCREFQINDKRMRERIAEDDRVIDRQIAAIALSEASVKELTRLNSTMFDRLTAHADARLFGEVLK